MPTLTGTTLYFKQTGATYYYSTDNSTWNTTTFPITLGTANATLTIMSSITLSATTSYFIIGANNQTIDGSYNLVYVSASQYPGMVRNGVWAYNTSSTIQPSGTTYTGATIKNVFIEANSSSNLIGISTHNNTGSNDSKYCGSWLTHIYFSGGVENCNAYGPLPLVTQYTTSTSYTLSASTGTTSYGGVLIGDKAIVNATNCSAYSITGGSSSSSRLFGSNSRGGSITNCHSSKSLMCNTENAVTATNCYTSSGSGANIFYNNGTVVHTAVNCYCKPSKISSSSTDATTTNCYINFTTWNDTSANENLITNTDVWTDVSINSSSVPYVLSSFTRNLYSSTTGTNVTTLSAISLPTQNYTWAWSIISISVNSGTAVASYSGISINSSTGTLTFSGLSQGSYAVKVMALYADSIYWLSTFTNTVAATNTAPTITSGTTASVSENISTSTTVYTVTATDPDAGNTLTYSISGGSDSALFNINSTTGVVTFKASPNYESPTDANSDNVYVITVRASDGSLYDEKSVSITVTNVNEAPTITSGATASVSENISTSTTVYTVTATDVDASTTLTYSISGGVDAALFNINSTTGVVTFKASPNYESPTDANSDNVYVITVRASDGSLYDEKSVSITVTNVNETATITGTYSGSITETNVTQTVSGTLNVSDPDAGQSSFIAQTDVSGNNSYGKFSINTSGNWTYTMNSAHNEFVASQTYTDSITVTSNDSTASQVITVTITGTNDIPTISGTYTGSITETNAVQTVTGTLSISDPDNGQSAFVAQTDVSGNNRYGKFSIDTSGNWSYTMNSAHNEFVAGQNYTDSITATSNDGTTTQLITVTITGANDTATIIGTYTGSITESDIAQSVTGTLSISDPDNGESSFVTQTDVSGNNNYGKFSIDTSGNWSYTMSSAHNEFVSGQTYTDSITVSSTDGSATRVITVTLTGSNDVPTITGTYTGSITETDVTQSVTGTLSISDLDTGAAYFIPQTDVSGNNQYGKFTIDSSGNWSYAMNSPHNEFEAGQTYTDSIIVHSNDGSATQVITVTMTGINDAPVITSGMFERTTTSIGTSTVYTVTAVDPDTNATLTYSISGGVDASLFTIDASSGAISFKTTPSPRVYSITVRVSDGSLSATQDVALMVTSSSVANYPLVTGNQDTITTSCVVYGDISVSDLSIPSGVEVYLASGSTMTALSGSFQGSLTGGGSLLKSGTGELTLSSSNTNFTGVLKVTEGTVKIQSADALGSGSIELGASDSSGNTTLKFDFSGPTSITNDIVASSTGENLVQNTGLYTLTLSGNLTKDGTTLTLSGDIEVTGTIEGSSPNSDVVISGDTIVYTSSSTTDYNGPTTIQDGASLTIENGVSIPNSDVTVESGGVFVIQNTSSMPTSVIADSVTLESNSILNLNSGFLKTNSLTISETISGAYADINLIPGSSAIIETGDLTISGMLYINITDALTSGSYDLIKWTGTCVVTGSVMVYYNGVSNVSISGAFNNTSKKYTITVTPASSDTTYTVGGTISGQSSEVVLKLNGTESITLAADATSFTFSTGLTSGTSYAVTIYSYSSSTQSYVLNYSTGTISSSNITSVSLVFSDTTTPGGTVCFPANTPVLTNEGYIPIDKIDPTVHTIRHKKIIAVTKTVSTDKHLVRIAKNALGENYPSKTVYSSRNHKVFYKGQMVKAKHLVELVENVTLSPYNGEPLYNILLEQHEKMQVNNLIVETLHPEHKVAKLYRILGMLTPSQQADLIKVYNKYDREYSPNAKK